MASDLVVHQLAFSKHNPPPEGFPMVVAEFVYTRAELSASHWKGCQEEQTLHAVMFALGLHLQSQTIIPELPPVRRTQEQRAKARRTTLRRREEKAHPLFAEQMIAEELAQRPDYYAGVSEGEEAVAGLDERQRAEYGRWHGMYQARLADKAEKRG